MELVLLFLVGILGWRAWTAFGEARAAHARWTRGLGATHTGVAELVAMAEAVRADLGTGAFRKVVALTGTVEPGGAGTRPAPVGGAGSVWFRVTEEKLSRGEKGSTERELVGDRRWDSPFLLRDGDATVVVDPRDARVEVPVAERRRDAHDPDHSGERDFGIFRILDTTLSHEHTEWRIEPGSRLTVVGEARLGGGPDAHEVRLAAAPGLPLTLSAGERTDHLEAGRTGSRAAIRRAAGYGIGAVLLLVLVIVL